MKTDIGKNYKVQYYKHDGKLYKQCDEAVLLDVQEDYIVVGNDRAFITEADGRTRKTREPAITYFFKEEWYNIIVQLKRTGTTYYCNISSPYIMEDETIKHIDYDLDLRIFADGTFKVLDRAEYNYHKKVYSYSDELDKIINKSLTDLINLYKSNFIGFIEEKNQKYYQEYLKLKNMKK